ncbi:MAG TPA: STAS domain-containing protein [Solirubrobacteraceae bacterium]|nr:STAS domain-containing protein [Solirubrobacteraceae bacterium]
MPKAFALIEGDSADSDRVIIVRGEIDVGNTAALRDWLVRASAGGRRSVTVDLSGVRFLAISGLYVLCEEQHRMAAHRSRLTVVCDDPRALQLIAVCRLEDTLHVVPSRSRGAARTPWSADDDARADRLAAWLERYTAQSA